MKISLFVAAAMMSASVAFAGCPGSAPKVNWNLQSGDQRVDDAYLTKLLSNRKVRYSSGGTESYKKNGSYQYSVGGQAYNAPEYKFYSNGVRCIGYKSPRFDLYVVNDKKLVLVNSVGERFKGAIK